MNESMDHYLPGNMEINEFRKDEVIIKDKNKNLKNDNNKDNFYSTPVTGNSDASLLQQKKLSNSKYKANDNDDYQKGLITESTESEFEITSMSIILIFFCVKK